MRRDRVIRKGYVHVQAIGHPRADAQGYVPEHIVIAERALGRFIEWPVLVHHDNRIKADNRDRTSSSVRTRRTTSCCTCGSAPSRRAATRPGEGASTAASTTPRADAGPRSRAKDRAVPSP